MTTEEFIQAIREIVKDLDGFFESEGYFEFNDCKDIHVICSGNRFSIIWDIMGGYFTHKDPIEERPLVIKEIQNHTRMRKFLSL